MVIQRLEMLIEFLKLALEFVFVFVQAMGTVIQECSTNSESSYIHLPYVGILP
ncbi:PHO85 cyclin-7 like [Actinidia chinensis var. chinensis]|uniref:PHO85 cyclin-7 like n=1 Tax=Actinidia chinensis var. chinensis TaxID=1590841 RepID=A0A2R6Q5L5_ACTCC|nr:PHO85 cyclin-7 like [Actinidia chinensis var. chinensis]